MARREQVDAQAQHELDLLEPIGARPGQFPAYPGQLRCF
jgi:hypothetical protein